MRSNINKKFWRIYTRRIVCHPLPQFLRKKGSTLVVRGFRWPVMDNLHFRYVRMYVCSLRTSFVCNQWPLYDSFKSFLNRDILKLQQAETLFGQKALLLLFWAQTSFCLVFLISRRGSDQFFILETSGRHIHVNAEIANRLVTFIFLCVNPCSNTD